ncbi:tRNA lysidine(34) synthetase TilS [Oculatella sp. LEGE 06141]|uniref:tRNA lysidine(34) synthetase TilS n=1 Tax=Oculatella sp. LEGE 06141 TaxID=1828648 RepID=UPI001882DE79|nr:tRNA lysidine(34) synthetase TilS [Oculatella sp. LEGE 06141]MBE9177396.1 tRNA lysidine(34) synthetase TilS [Oculatella sp. LEGE 06141]
MVSSRWTLLHARVHRTVRQRQLLQQQQRLLVAVSGGQDSLCLVRLLLDLQPKWEWELAIAHCDHRWRSDSLANADYVESLAQAWNVKCHRAVAAEAVTTEAEARHWRYEVLATLAQSQGYSAVVTGHTASDRAETLLYNLIRGSGADGLQALTWNRLLVPGVQLVRPLLEITRTETAQFCQTAHLPIWEDSTNHDQRFARNRIRQELLPYLQTHFNPQAEQALAQTAELLRADVEYLEMAVDLLWQQAVGTASHAEQLNRPVLQQAPLALQRRVLRRFLQTILPSAPRFEHIEKLAALITAPNRTQTDPFPGDAIAQVEGDWIVLRSNNNR